ncbi:MAG: hypothetical protein ACI4AO_09345 [Anaerotignum sp.]
MEKEKKGLFGRLLDFWKEKIGAGETKGIGFWNGAKNVQNPFIEMGDAVSLKQEKKKTFWEEKVETVLGEKEETGGLLEQERKFFFAEAEKKREGISETVEDGEGAEERKVSHLFTAEVFREERQAEAEKSKMGQAFLWERPEEERDRRSIVPVAEEAEREKAIVSEGEQEMPKTETVKREEPQTETELDIEKLMQEMTKKLWEERESCGRRLRG